MYGFAVLLIIFAVISLYISVTYSKKQSRIKRLEEEQRKKASLKDEILNKIRKTEEDKAIEDGRRENERKREELQRKAEKEQEIKREEKKEYRRIKKLLHKIHINEILLKTPDAEIWKGTVCFMAKLDQDYKTLLESIFSRIQTGKENSDNRKSINGQNEELFLEIDFHGLNLIDAMSAMSLLKGFCENYRSMLVIIHGYTRGDALKKFFSSYKSSNSLQRIPNENKGRTIFIFNDVEKQQKRIDFDRYLIAKEQIQLIDEYTKYGSYEIEAASCKQYPIVFRNTDYVTYNDGYNKTLSMHDYIKNENAFIAGDKLVLIESDEDFSQHDEDFSETYMRIFGHFGNPF